MKFEDEPFVRNEVGEKLKPILEKWAGIKLAEKATIFGIRRYEKLSTLNVHVDKYPTHTISAILQIDQKVDTDWPLLVKDLKGKTLPPLGDFSEVSNTLTCTYRQ